MRHTFTAVGILIVILAGRLYADPWVLRDVALRDTANFIVENGSGTINSRSDLPADPGERFNIALTGSGWQEVTIGDSSVLPYPGGGIEYATGNAGDLSDYSAFQITIGNPSSSAWFKAGLCLNTGLASAGEPENAYRDAIEPQWVGPGQAVTLTLRFDSAAQWNGNSWQPGAVVLHTNHVSNIGLLIGVDLGQGDRSIPPGQAFDVDVVSGPNSLVLDFSGDRHYLKPGDPLVINMNAVNLAQRVNGCQSMLGFSSYYLTAAQGCVEPGGGVWDQLIYNSWDVGSGVPGEIDTAVGVNAQGGVGTEADGTVAKITLTAASHEGSTRVVFRTDEGDTQSTFFSGIDGQAVWPAKVGSKEVVIDGTSPSVTVLQPNGGESLVGGRVYEIKWNASDAHLASNPIKIEYSAGGVAGWVQVAANEANDGSYLWTTPPPLDTSEAKVRVTALDLAGNAASDESDAPFTVAAANRLALDLTGAAYVRPGNPVRLNLDVFNLTERVNGCQAMIGYSSFYLTAAPGCVQAGGGVWDQLIYNSWDVGSGTPGEIDTAIGVNAQGSVGTEADGTVAKISLIAGQQEGTTSIVFRPDQGEIKSTFLSNMAGQALWPNKINSQPVVIDGTPPVVTVLQPDGGQSLVGGQIYEITWTAADTYLGPTPIKIEYSLGGGAGWVLVAQNEANDGSYSWTVPPPLDTSEAKVRITATDLAGNAGMDESDGVFTIRARDRLSLDATQSSLFVKPGAQVLVDMNIANLSQKVNACQAMVGFSSFFLTASQGCVQAGGGVWDQLIYNSWDIGAGIPGEIDTAIGVNAQGNIGTEADGTIAKIALTAGPNQGVTSLVFRPDQGDTKSTFLSNLSGLPLWPNKIDSKTIVVDGTAPSVIVLQPNGGEVLPGGSVYEIKWTASDAYLAPDSVKIEYSTNNGSTWTLLAQNEANDGSFLWSVPNVDTSTARVRVSASDKATNTGSDTSDVAFTIDSASPTLNITSAKQSTTAGPFNAPGFTYRKIISGGTRTLTNATFSPDGTKIAYIDRDILQSVVYYVKLHNRTTGITTVIGAGTRGVDDFYSFLGPYFSYDGTKIGWTRGHEQNANDLQVYDLRTGVAVTYQPTGSGVSPDVANSDFFGSCTDQWVAWDRSPGLNTSDLFSYSANYGSPLRWQQTGRLTITSTFSEYEPDSDRAGKRVLYWSGETVAEPKDTVHLLSWNGSAWVKDSGFQAIPGATWPVWSLDETEIGVSKYDQLPGAGPSDLYVYDSTGHFKFDLTGPAIGQGSKWQSFGFNFAVGPAGAGRQYLFTSDADNTTGGRDIWIAQRTPELLYSARGSSDDVATQGAVYFHISAADTASGLASPPAVQVVDSAGVAMPVTYVGGSGSSYSYSVAVNAGTANGRATVSAIAADRAGHSSTDVDYLDINKNRITGSVSFVTLSRSPYFLNRDVTFAATNSSGTVLKRWTANVLFTNNIDSQIATGTFVLDGAPVETAALSAKTSLSLRKKQQVSLDANGQAASAFTVLGGDLDGTNNVTIMDYSELKAKWATTTGMADITGDGLVQTLDYSVQRSSWMQTGDSE